MFVLHLLLSKVILEIKSKQNRKSTQTVNKWMHEEAKSKMFLRELKYFDKNVDGSKKLWFHPKKWYKEGRDIDLKFKNAPYTESNTRYVCRMRRNFGNTNIAS